LPSRLPAWDEGGTGGDGADGSGPLQARAAAEAVHQRGPEAGRAGARIHCALDGRTAVSIEDIRRVALPSLRHRVILNFQGEAESRNVDQIVEEVITSVSNAVTA
jgi:MoxR-like ATPase